MKHKKASFDSLLLFSEFEFTYCDAKTIATGIKSKTNQFPLLSVV